MAKPKNELKSAIGNKSGGLLQKLKKAAKCENAEVMADYDNIEPRDFIDTGNYLLNSLISADPKKGMPSGKIMTLAGPPGCGKSFTALELIKNAQKVGYSAILYDTELANNNKESLKAKGIDIDNLLYIPIGTIEELKTSILNILEEIEEDDKVIIVIDSLGNLSSTKEMEDSLSGSDKKDMTKSAVMKGLFRTITLASGLKQVPIIGISHVYAAVGSFIPQNVVGGGSGIQYMSSIVIQFTKAQDKIGTDVVGAVVTAKTDKNRFAKERSKIKFSINFNTGMNRYAGLLTFCEDEKLFVKDGRSFVYEGTKYSPKELNKEFWETQINGSLGEYIKNKFRYMSVSDDLGLDEMIDDMEED